MATIKEEAQAYEPKLTKNVADLPKVDVNMNMEDRTGTDKEGKEFSYKVVVIDGEDYRMPTSVIGQIKTILENRPTQTYVKVVKKGQGMNTEYTVIQVD